MTTAAGSLTINGTAVANGAALSFGVTGQTLSLSVSGLSPAVLNAGSSGAVMTIGSGNPNVAASTITLVAANSGNTSGTGTYTLPSIPCQLFGVLVISGPFANPQTIAFTINVGQASLGCVRAAEDAAPGDLQGGPPQSPRPLVPRVGRVPQRGS